VGRKSPRGSRAVADPGIDLGGAHGELVEREPITGVWGGAPSGVQGQSPWSGGQGGEPLLKLKAFQLSSIQWKRQKCLVFSTL